MAIPLQSGPITPACPSSLTLTPKSCSKYNLWRKLFCEVRLSSILMLLSTQKDQYNDFWRGFSWKSPKSFSEKTLQQRLYAAIHFFPNGISSSIIQESSIIGKTTFAFVCHCLFCLLNVLHMNIPFLLPMPIAWTPFRKPFFFFRREVGQLQGRLGHQPEK